MNRSLIKIVVLIVMLFPIMSFANPLAALRIVVPNWLEVSSEVERMVENSLKRDRDGDGIRDKKDKCPDQFGLKEFDGCPDSDGDGVQDSLDHCPDTPGALEFNGCPDSDGDGFTDREDLCPELPGLEQFNGCPDSDNDGVMESKDDCPNVPGLIENKGCPIEDADGDGVADENDKCPDLRGDVASNGCPFFDKVAQDAIDQLARTIYFTSGSDQLTNESKIRLDQVANILLYYPQMNYHIEGHTDSTGSAKVNQSLSEKRAASVASYLISKGLTSDQLKTSGYGSTQPIADNNSTAGRQQNRRVEIKGDYPDQLDE